MNLSEEVKAIQPTVINIIGDTIRQYHPELYHQIYTSSLFPERLAANILSELLSKAWWVKKEEWISVENPPKESGMYLCYDVNTPSRNKCEIYYYSKHKNDWSIGMDTYHPQYWQPLPSPPQNK